ncbi:MAG: aminotransferase class V-fold PLP-dependent enzyme [Chloroflexi bacterium]|nr:aminotransferase class V-fold PLP-dependent enzyme [Chloroflexota bacterium]
MTDHLLHLRRQFPIVEETTYLVSHSLGAMPREVYTRLHDYAEDWALRGVRNWKEQWWDLNGQVGDKVGGIINAQPSSVSIHENLSTAASIFLSGVTFPTGRDKVVIDDMIFPTMYYVLRGMLTPDLQLHQVPSQDGISVPLDALLDAIDERTALVSVSHVLFRSAYIMDVQAIIEKAHRVGALVLLDAYHSVGVIPVDVQALNVDVLIGGVLKWLCGGPGGVFMYVRPDLRPQITPRITGWFAHKRPFDFEVGEIELRDDAYRFLNGTFNVSTLYAMQPGLEVIAQAGVDRIRAKSRHQTALLIELAQNAGYPLATPLNADERAGTVTIAPPNAYAISRALLDQEILVDYRENAGIRISPHFYTSDAELHHVIEAIADILASGAWERYSASRDFVT